jgi:chromate transporter
MQSEHAPPTEGPPSALKQLRAWVTIGSQSLGGGASSLYLMRAILVERMHWVSLKGFVQEWTLSRLSPGNHLTALATLLGHRIGGRRGAAIAVVGLLVPSGLITVALTATFALVREQPALQSALAGVAPMTIGMMIGLSITMLRTIVRTNSAAVVVDLGLLCAAVACGFLIPGATMIVIITGALIGIAFLGRDELPPETTEG